MSLKKGLLYVLVIVLLLIPLAQLLRTQNPWDCFNFTYDESYFLQTASNWSEGRGYRTHDQVKPFEPLITVGVPMAWGAHAVQSATGMDLGHAGRTWVHICFYALLLLIALSAFLRNQKNWIAPLLALVIFSLGIRGISYGSYFVYGFLSETPAIVLGMLSLIALDRRRLFLCGVLAVACFILKPTFLLLLPAVGLAALISYRKKGIWTGAAVALSLAAYWSTIAGIREQGLVAYIQDYFRTILQVSLTYPGKNIFNYYQDTGWLPALFTLAVLGFGSYAAFRSLKNPKTSSPSQMAAFFLVGAGISYYLVTKTRPVEKQWGAVLCLALSIFSIHWAGMITKRAPLSISQPILATAFLAVVVTWLINVPPMMRKNFQKIEETACPSKEQRYIDHELRALVDLKKLEKKDLGVLISSPSFNMFLYELGWNPAYHEQWKDLGLPLPKMVVGQVDRLLPAPAGCSPAWMGSRFGMIRCGN